MAIFKRSSSSDEVVRVEDRLTGPDNVSSKPAPISVRINADAADHWLDGRFIKCHLGQKQKPTQPRTRKVLDHVGLFCDWPPEAIAGDAFRLIDRQFENHL
jgi:hypothetical protein